MTSASFVKPSANKISAPASRYNPIRSITLSRGSLAGASERALINVPELRRSSAIALILSAMTLGDTSGRPLRSFTGFIGS